DVRSRGVGLEAAVVATLAAAAFGVDGGVPDLPGTVRRAVVQLSVEDDAPADAGADGDPDGVAGSPRRSHPPFPQDGTVGIVVERGRQLQPVMDNLAEREVDPPEVGREEDHSALG